MYPFVHAFYLHKEDEMFEGGVQVGFLLKLNDRVKVLVVDVSIDPKEALQDGLGHRHEVLGERNTWKGRAHDRQSANEQKTNIHNRLWRKGMRQLSTLKDTVTFNDCFTEKQLYHILTNLGREESLVIQLILHPGHEVVDVLWGRTLNRFLNIRAISPVILIPGR